ncbi:hypothetical protein RD792_009353 [Penstemon davidsonii]|uniref:Ubiquitin-like domain-containing protein n=1 Tax=Penstemon davidsonii TaxID=160366 RepID=A0ABR0D079_9LAMI|nr:hypothetical protein RD792_009353 [Penstemon davidsonii]
MKWLLNSLLGDSNVQLQLRVIEDFCGLTKRDTMAEGDKGLELKFRIYDGTDIGHGTYSSSISVATLKQRLLSEWPQGKSHVPKSVNDMKLIHAGRVLENGKTLVESGVHVGDIPGGVLTMHVVVQPTVAKKKTGILFCPCVILLHTVL